MHIPNIILLIYANVLAGKTHTHIILTGDEQTMIFEKSHALYNQTFAF